MSKKVLVTGSFDPPTIGHLEMITEAARIFDDVVVCVFRNQEKEYLFSESERAAMLHAMIAEQGLSTVTVDVSGGYVADYAHEKRIGFDVRFRMTEISDYETTNYIEVANINKEEE